MVREYASRAGCDGMVLKVCRWKGGRDFAYSITYDEGFVDLLTYAAPIHRQYHIPGHLVMVAGQLGQVRNVPSSTYDGAYRHLSGSQLRELISEGWSVGNHSLTHGDLNNDTYNEVVTSKRLLEEAIGQPVNLFHLPGADFSYAPAARHIDACGFLAVFFTDDRVNDAAPDLFGLARALVYVREGQPDYTLYDPFPRVYDPYHRLHEARACGGWLVDMTHLVTPDPPAPWKDTTPELLNARFDCLRRVGAGTEWAAEPEEVVDYILTRRAVSLAPLPAVDERQRALVQVARLPSAVKRREISIALGPADSLQARAWLDGRELMVVRGVTVQACTFEAVDGAVLEVQLGRDWR